MRLASFKRFFSSIRRFNNQVALVTGGAQGIGRAIAKTLNHEGATVVIADNDIEMGKATARATGSIFIKCDFEKTE